MPDIYVNVTESGVVSLSPVVHMSPSLAAQVEQAVQDAEEARDIAITGVQYPTAAAAAAAISEGDFASYLVDGLPTYGQKTGGVMVALPGPWLDADKLGHTDTGANAVTVTQRAFNILQPIRVGLFTSLEAGIVEAMATGRTLIIDGAHAMPSGLTFVMSGDLNIEVTHRGLLEYTGTTPAWAMLRFIMKGHRLRIFGDNWEMNPNNLCSFVFRAENDEDTDANIEVHGLRAYDSYVDSTAGWLGAVATNINAVGRFENAHFENCIADGCRRSASWAADGVTQAFIVARSTFQRGPKHIKLVNCIAKDARTPDVAYGNADGFAIFQNFEDGATFVAEGCKSINNQGRGFKGQNGSAVPVLRDFYLYRDIQAAAGSGAGTIDIVAQYQRLVIDGATIEYRGAATHTNPAVASTRAATTIINAAHTGTNDNGELSYGMGIVDVRNVEVRNFATDTNPISLIEMGGGGDSNEWLVNIDNVKIAGGSVKHGLRVRSLGLTQKANIRVNGLIAPFATAANKGALFLGEGNNKSLTANVSNCWNTGPDNVAAYRHYADAAVVNFGQYIDGGNNMAILRHTGEHSPVAAGLKPGVTTGAEADVRGSYGGFYLCDNFEVNAGETITIDVAEKNFDLWLKVMTVGNGPSPAGRYVIAHSDTITVERACSRITLGVGSEPSPSGAGLLLWWNNTAGTLSIKSVGDTHYVTREIKG